MAKSNLAVRLLTVAVVAPPLLSTMFLGPAWGFYLIVFVVTVVGAIELFAMTHPGDRIAQAIGTLTTAGVSITMYVDTHDSRTLITLMCVVTVLGALVPLWRLGKIEDAALRILAGIAGPFYVGGLLCTIALIRRDLGSVGPHTVLFALMVAWLGDTGGYFAGRYLGRTKLYPAVSPKKTREGFAGSLGGSVAGSLLAHFWYLQSLPLGQGILLALFAGALGQFGDLVESLLKRSTGIKDSGSIVPGHGGVLDRIDALLIVSPIIYLYAVW